MAQASKVFRVFVSSTFSDLKAERDALQQYVFPRLRELCVQHGCRFQAIDLRWGVSEEASREQPMRICLGEIERCRRITPRPNFIVLIGDRYGARPVPFEIPASEFQQIETRVTNLADRNLLQAWYRRDDNAVPPVYLVRPRTDEFTNLTSWDVVERRLRTILVGAIADLSLPADARLKYVASATEQEIVEGALRGPHAADHVFGFFRVIRNVGGSRLPEDLPPDPAVANFVDLTDHEQLDREAHDLLEDLKSRLRAALPGNINNYEATWTRDHITLDHLGSLPQELDVCIRLVEDPDAPKTLCVAVWQRLARVILEEIAQIATVDPLDREISSHDAFGAERARFFIGRKEMLQTIADYLRRDANHPLVIIGASGSGKSALMAHAAKQMREGIKHAASIVRFIGATPSSADGRALLDSLCRQIGVLYAADATFATDYQGLLTEFSKRLALATKERPLALFLDAVDQFSEFDPARFLNWLPTSLPAHVRLVVSLSLGDLSAMLQQRLPADSVVQLDPMKPAEGEVLLDLWLRGAGRTLKANQRAEVIKKFDENGLPLYLRLAFEEASRWPSFAEPPLTQLNEGIAAIIRENLFARLAAQGNHGAVFVSRSLGYLAAAKSGLTEDELLDLLSRDTEVLADFHRRSPRSPVVDRLPVVVWSRLFFDLEPYLAERSADNAILMTFYHRQLRDAVDEVYLSGEDKKVRHVALAAYFASQTLFAGAASVPNVRKLAELPYQQTYGELWPELYNTLTDFDFLEAKCTHIAVTTEQGTDRKIYGGVYELQEDYRRALEKFPNI